MNIWKTVSKCDTYEVREDGAIRKIGKIELKKPTVAAVGYPVVHLWKGGKGKVFYVHDLVTSAFIGPKPAGWNVNHIDGDKTNFTLSNLEYVTSSGNMIHAMTTGLNDVRGEKNFHSKLTTVQAREIYSRSNNGESTIVLAKEFGVRSPIVSQIKNRTRWKHIHADLDTASNAAAIFKS